MVAGALDVRGAYAGADDLWAALATGTGPAGAFFQRLTAAQRDVVRRHVHDRFGALPFSLTARAWYATGRA